MGAEMRKSLDAFAARIRHAAEVLALAKKEILDQEDEIFAMLRKAGKDLRPAATKGEASEWRKGVERILADWPAMLDQWEKRRKESSKVREDLEKYGSGLIVSVFGRTNAGKSTLGNFIRGRSLRGASFENAWKHGDFRPSPIQVIEKGRDAENIIGEDWFKEGTLETTREAQIFTLPGLLWLDTPGFGSTTPELGDLARKYVSHADMVIYLDHTDNPGLASNAHELCRLLEHGHLTLLVVNQSDKKEKVRGGDGRFVMENGRPVTREVPKDAATRKGQEDQLIKSLKDLDFTGTCDAISMSMLLANNAVRDDDDDAWAGSNVGGLLERMGRLIDSDEKIRMLKSRESRHALADLISSILGDGRGEGGSSLSSMEAALRGTRKAVEDAGRKFDVGILREDISAAICHDARAHIRKAMAADEAGMRGASTSHAVDTGFLRTFITEEASKRVADAACRLLSDLFRASERNMSGAFPDLGTYEARRKIETRQYVDEMTERVRRKPDGFFEHILSWFGREFYEYRKKSVTSTQTFDHGTNHDEIVAELSETMRKAVPAVVGNMLDDIRSTCVEGSLKEMDRMLEALAGTRKALEDRRGRILQELEAERQRLG